VEIKGFCLVPPDSLANRELTSPFRNADTREVTYAGVPVRCASISSYYGMRMTPRVKKVHQELCGVSTLPQRPLKIDARRRRHPHSIALSPIGSQQGGRPVEGSCPGRGGVPISLSRERWPKAICRPRLRP